MAEPSIPAGPCRQWLGIEPDDLPIARRVLGILPAEADPMVVLEAAKARIRLLRGIDAGPLEPVRRALLERVEAAREEVLGEIAAAGRAGHAPAAPRRPAGPAFAMPPPPPGQSRPASRADVTPAPPPVADTAPIAIQVRRPLPRRRSGPPALFVVGSLCLVALAGLLGFLTWQKRSPGRAPREIAQRDAAAAEPTAAGRSPEPSRRPTGQRAVAPSDGSQAALDAVTAAALPPAAAPGDAGAASAPPPVNSQPAPDAEPMADGEPEGAPDEPMDDAGEAAPPADADPAMAPEEAGQPAPAVAAIPGPFDDPAAPRPAPAVDAGTTADGALDAGLAAVRRALAQRDFPAAEDGLAAVARTVRGDDERDRVAAWEQLVDATKRFVDYRDKALATVTAGQDYDIDGKKVVIVEIDDTKLVYRTTGKNTTVPRARIPGKILLAIVTAWFDDRPQNQVFLGAHHATKPEPDLDAARACWETAAAAGVDAAALLGLLDDKALVPADE